MSQVGTPKNIGRPGARGKILGVRGLYVRDHGRVLALGNEGTCLAAALINGIAEVRGVAVAEQAWARISECDLKSVAASNSFVHTLQARVELRKVKMCGVDPFEWLGNQKRGVFVVRVFKVKEVDHCIVVNARKNIIVDSAEMWPLMFSVETIKMCGGSDLIGLRIGEVREVVAQMSKKGNLVDVVDLTL